MVKEELSDKLINEEKVKKRDLESNAQLTSSWEYKDYGVYRYFGGLCIGLIGGYSLPLLFQISSFL